MDVFAVFKSDERYQCPRSPLKPASLYVGVSGLPSQSLHGTDTIDEGYCTRIGWNTQRSSFQYDGDVVTAGSMNQKSITIFGEG